MTAQQREIMNTLAKETIAQIQSVFDARFYVI